MNKFKIIKAFFIGLLIIGMISPLAGQELEWQLAKDKDGISVYTRQAEGSKLKEFKALATINAPIEKLVAMIYNTAGYKDWMTDLKSVIQLEGSNKNELITYTEVEIPWPAENRDIITLYQFKNETGNDNVRIDLTSIAGDIPEKDGLIRMTNANGFWEFTSQGNDKTYVHYQFLADPGGNIPTWLINMFIVEGPFETLNNMKNIAEGLIEP